MMITIKELTTHDEMATIYPLISQRNPSLDLATFANLLSDMLPMGYRCVAAFGETGAMVGVSGFWIMPQFYCRRSLRVDNFIVDENHRGQGIGQQMLDWLQDEGAKNGCTQAILDSLTGNTESHRFYFREGFKIIGFHFAKQL